MLILSTHGRDAAPAMVEEIAHRCDGLVVMGRTVPDAVVERLAARGVPLVMLARPQVAGIDSVKADNFSGAAELLRHLVAAGARTVTLVGDPGHSPDVEERWAGIASAALDLPDVVLTHVPVPLLDETAGAGVVEEILAAGLPDAFVCANDELALGLLTALAKPGSGVPGDVLVTGLGRHHGRAVRRPHHRPPADALAGRDRGAASRRGHHRRSHRTTTRSPPHGAGRPGQLPHLGKVER